MNIAVLRNNTGKLQCSRTFLCLKRESASLEFVRSNINYLLTMFDVSYIFCYIDFIRFCIQFKVYESGSAVMNKYCQ